MVNSKQWPPQLQGYFTKPCNRGQQQTVTTTVARLLYKTLQPWSTANSDHHSCKVTLQNLATVVNSKQWPPQLQGYFTKPCNRGQQQTVTTTVARLLYKTLQPWSTANSDHHSCKVTLQNLATVVNSKQWPPQLQGYFTKPCNRGQQQTVTTTVARLLYKTLQPWSTANSDHHSCKVTLQNLATVVNSKQWPPQLQGYFTKPCNRGQQQTVTTTVARLLYKTLQPWSTANSDHHSCKVTLQNLATVVNSKQWPPQLQGYFTKRSTLMTEVFPWQAKNGEKRKTSEDIVSKSCWAWRNVTLERGWSPISSLASLTSVTSPNSLNFYKPFNIF